MADRGVTPNGHRITVELANRYGEMLTCVFVYDNKGNPYRMQTGVRSIEETVRGLRTGEIPDPHKPRE